MPHKILIVEDDPAIREMLDIDLGSQFHLAFCADGNTAVDIFNRETPDLVLLDLMLPGKNGIQICQEIREYSGTPIIMLTARSDSDDVVAGLGAGADDYVVKGVKSAEIIARINRRLRPLKPTEGDKQILNIGPLTVDTVAHEVRRDGELISLTPLEFELLVTLGRHPEKAFKREELLKDVWGYAVNPDPRFGNKPDTRLVNVHVQRLRSKIGDDSENPTIVVTVRGVGYRAGQG
ncbi:MAG: MtrAB system response regulator MtrA [Micrococcales bacterium]